MPNIRILVQAVLKIFCSLSFFYCYNGKDHNSGKSQSSMTSVKYHFQDMETINGKFHHNPLRNVGRVADTRTSVDEMAKTDKRP